MGYTSELSQIRKAFARLQGKYRLTQVAAESDVYGALLLIQNESTGIKIQFAPKEFLGVSVDVGRLIQGSFPRHPIDVGQETKLDSFDLRDIAGTRLEMLNPSQRKQIKEDLPLKPDDAANIVERCCSDLLEGKFGVFRDLDQIVKNRARILAKNFPR